MNESKENDFLTAISHELKTPLTIIQEGVSQIQDEILGETTQEQKKCLGIVLEHTQRLSRIIDDFLNLSKFEGNLRLRKKMTSLADLTSRVCEAFEPLFQKKKLVLKRAFASDEERLFLDEDRIAQVLTNLLDNALKFTSQGSVEVQVLNEKNHVVCQINDTGMGIDPKDLPHLLNPAREASSKHTSMLRGTGLGLSLAKKILRPQRQ